MKNIFYILFAFTSFMYSQDGCTDSSACNYDPSADLDDGSCDYVDFECETCENGVVLANDDDIDVICNNVDTCFGFNP